MIKKNITKYIIINTYLAGLVLEGWEVKFIKNKYSFKLRNSYIIFDKNIFLLKNSFIDIYNKNINSKSNRDRKLLLNKIEIKEITYEIIKNKFKLKPLKIIYKNNYIKLKIAIISVNNGKNLKLWNI